MRTFRNAALAGATALALTVSGTSVAMAETDPANNGTDTAATANENKGSSNNEGTKRSLETRIAGTLGIKHGDSEEAKETRMVDGRTLFGATKGNQSNAQDSAKAGDIIYGLFVALGVAAGFSFLIAPIYNFIKFGPFA